VVHGDMNTDHPIAGGARVAARYPNSRFVAIPQAGQSAAGWSDCAKRIIRSFVAELDPGDTHCAADEREVFPGVGAFPRRVRNYAPAVVDPAHRDRSRRRDRRVAAAAVHTYLDVVSMALDRAQGTTGRGLRGGSWSVEFSDTGATLTLDRARLVEDVTVSGTGFFSWDPSLPNSGEFTVAGRGTTPGTITLSGDSLLDNTKPMLHVSGRIGNHPLRLLVPIH
jgi:hypothetical protein